MILQTGIYSLVVHHVIPFCYVKLLLEAKCHFNSLKPSLMCPYCVGHSGSRPLLKQVSFL